MTPEQELWQAVVFQAVIDATNPAPKSKEALNDQRRADSWLRSAGKDFRDVCVMAGMDPDFISEAYRAGRIDRKILKAASETRRAPVDAF